MKLTVEGLTYSYFGRRDLALKNLSFEVSEFPAVVLGPNGAGKTTVFGLLTARLRSRVGRIEIAGNSMASRRGRRQLRTFTGWLPQEVRPMPGLRAREQVAYFGWLKGLRSKDAWEKAEGALAMVGLSDEASTRSSALSGGQLRRLGIAQALVHSPSVLILDEPYAGLDPHQRGNLRDLLIELSELVAIVVSTHQTEDLSEIYRTVIVIDHGELRFTGDTVGFLSLAGDDVPARFRAEHAYRQTVGVQS